MLGGTRASASAQNAPSCCTFRRYRAYATFKSTIVSSTSSAPMRSSRLCRLKVTSFMRSEEHTSELQSRLHLVCRLLLEKKKKKSYHQRYDQSNVIRQASTPL